MNEWTKWHEYHKGKIELIAGIDCWIWTGCAHPRGYGRVNSRSGHYYAHRAAFEAYNGYVDQNLMVRHLCGCAGCVRPTHLAMGTAADNGKDMSDMQTTRSDLSHDDVRELRRLYDAGKPLDEIATHFNIAFGTVYPIVSHKSFRHVDPHLKGKHKRRLKQFISDSQISEVRLLFLDGWKNADIARRFGINKSAVSNIRTGKRYADR